MIKDYIIKILEIVIFIFMGLITVFSIYWGGEVIGRIFDSLFLGAFFGAIIGIIISIFFCGIVLIMLKNNELLKEIRNNLKKK